MTQPNSPGVAESGRRIKLMMFCLHETAIWPMEKMQPNIKSYKDIQSPIHFVYLLCFIYVVHLTLKHFTTSESKPNLMNVVKKLS